MITILSWTLSKFSVFFYIIHQFFFKLNKKIDPWIGSNLTKKDKFLISKNSELKNKYSDVKRCFILACGPSIRTQDLKKLEGEFCITMSNFYVHPDFGLIKPNFHVFAPSEPQMTDEYIGKLFNDFEKHNNHGTEVIASITDKDAILKYNGLINTNYYLYHTKFIYPKDINFNFDFSSTIPLIPSVSHAAIYLAINIGIKEIYLLGCDHDMILNIGTCKHFYEEDKNEFTKNGKTDWENDIDLEVLGGHYKNMWAVYKQLNEYANHNGIKIINITPNSLLDVFPRTTFDTIINKKEGVH